MWEVWADLNLVWVSEIMTYVLLHGFLWRGSITWPLRLPLALTQACGHFGTAMAVIGTR